MTAAAAPRRVEYPVAVRIFLGLVIVAALVIAIGEALDQTRGGDFAVFWRTGGHFAAGEELYQVTEGERAFFYPPFAALVFQGLSLLPLVPAAVVFSIASVLAAVWCYRLTTTILAEAFPGRRVHWGPYVAAVVLGHRYLLNNLTMVQVNIFLFALALAGALLLVRGKGAWAAFVFMLAAGMKVMPLILVAWALVRSPRTAWRGALAGLAVVALLPVLWRGPSRGAADLRAYHTAFLGEFLSGRVVHDYTNQNLASAIFRATQARPNPERLDYQLVALAPRTTERITLVALGAVAVAFGAATLLRAWRGQPIHAVELVGAFLAWHLLSGITWKAHLVSFLFVFAFILSCRADRLPRGTVALWRVTVGLLTVLAWVGRDIVGRTAHYYFGGYSALTVLMLLMFTLAIWLMVSRTFDADEAAAALGIRGAAA